MLTDEDIVFSAKEGNPLAFSQLVEGHLKRVYNFLYRYIGNRADAEEIAQETFLKVWKNIGKFDERKNFAVWLFVIARRTALDWLKKKKPTVFSDFNKSEADNSPWEETLADPAPLPANIFSQKELETRVEKILAGLGEEERLVLLLHYYEDLTFEVIAEGLRQSVNTVKSRHRRALLKLREKLIRHPN